MLNCHLVCRALLCRVLLRRTLGWIIVCAGLGFALPARAEMVGAVVSLAAPPATPIGAADLIVDFDPNVLTPIFEADPQQGIMIDPIGEGMLLFGNFAVNQDDQLIIAVVAVGGYSTVGPMFEIYFDTDSMDPLPNPTIQPQMVTDTISDPIIPTPSFSIAMAPEPAQTSLGIVALAVLGGLARLRAR